MGDTLESLEQKREHLYGQLRGTGDFRRGIISVIYRKCGKKNCVCAQEGHPGHGPLHLWNTTIKGKSYAKNLRFGTELLKYSMETANYRRFVKLCKELVELNEKVCDLRPLPVMEGKDKQEATKKKLEQLLMKRLKKR